MNTTRAALGRTAALGDLYDARCDDFCGISIFRKSLPEAARAISDSQFSDIHLVHTDDFSEKMTKMDVSAELQVSVLAGLFRLQGSGRYLNDQKMSARTVKSSLIYNVKTKQESVNIYHEDLENAFAIKAIESGVATHVVVGIEWGANSVITCQYENRENRDIKEIEGNLSAQLKSMALSISGRASLDFREGDQSTGIKFDIRMYGDILPKNGELPTTFEGAVELMKQLPTLVAASNGGKGKPLNYRLIPISLLKDYLNFSIKADAMIKTLEDASLVRVVQLFDQMKQSQQTFNDFFQDVNEFSYCVKPDDREKVWQLKNDVGIQETSFRSELCTILTNVRSGRMDASHLEKLLEKFQSSVVSPQKLSTSLEGWRETSERINFARALVKSGAVYIGYGSSLDEEILKNFEAKCYILYFCQKAKADHPEIWEGNRQLFFQEMKKSPLGHTYYVVDCDLQPITKIKHGTSCVQVVLGGQILETDLLAKQRKISQTSFLQSTSGSSMILSKPSKLVPFTTVCPGKLCDRSRIVEWVCKNCVKSVEYGFDEHVYCNCGKTNAFSIEFKCSDPKHGVAFEAHQQEFLQHLLSSFRTFPGVNILVLGESYENRAKWIRQLIRSMATKYTGQEMLPQQQSDKDYEIHTYLADGTTVRIIDIPDNQVNNSRRNILGGLSYLEDLHGICILLNNSQITNSFKMSFKQLSSCFGPRGRENVVFATFDSGNARVKPEQTVLLLKKLAWEYNENEIAVLSTTVFSFGSSLQQHGMNENLKESTKPQLCTDVLNQNNASEAKRMLSHIRQVQPVSLKEKIELLLHCKFVPLFPNLRGSEIPIDHGLKPGDKIRVHAIPNRDFKVVDIALAIETSTYENVPFWLAFRRPPWDQEKVPCVVRLTRDKSKGLYEERDGLFPIQEEKQFELEMVCGQKGYEIFIDGKHFCDYTHRLPLDSVKVIRFFGHFVLTFLKITSS